MDDEPKPNFIKYLRQIGCGFIVVYPLLAIVVIAISLAFLAGAVWVVVWMLKYMGVL